APSPAAPRNPVVTSTRGVRVGRTIQDFVTAVDVLSPGAVTTSLAVGLIALLAGLALTRTLFLPSKQWLVYGIVSTAWGLLALRTALAVLYAGSPELLDRLAVSGMRVSLVAAGVIPGVMLLTAFVRAEQYGGRHVAVRRSAARWATAYLAVLLGV